MDVDFKQTIWERVEIPEEHEGMVLLALKNGEINSMNEMFDWLGKHAEDGLTCTHLAETDEQMSLEDNGGSSTIEVIKETETIWQNGE